MHITLAAVMSLDGKIKRDEQVHKRDWVSDEDKAYFSQLIADHDLIVMGRKSYKSMQLRPRRGKRFIIVTRYPEKYKQRAVGDELEFTNEAPSELAARLKRSGRYSRLLLAGGSEMYRAFLKEGLVDELHITIEPVIFGSGLALVDGEDLNVKLRLVEIRKLNDQGTILLKMEVER